ncbi:MAG: choice-of-anchor tandem repeat GloVer-containing protein [Ginsengibacter sp.]
MKRTVLFSVLLLLVTVSFTQGVYQLWGTTQAGGAQGTGVIYSTDRSGNNFRVRYEFTNGSDGTDPLCRVTPLNGKLYGTTRTGGSNDAGVIFEWDPSSENYSKKIDLNVAGGRDARGYLVFTNGKFYGSTYAGGNDEKGIIYEWDPVTNQFDKKFDFSSVSGYNPNGSLTLSGNKFYGTAGSGGIYQDYFNGVIFEWDPVSNVYTKKIDFGANLEDGYAPFSTLMGYGEKFYGTTAGGGVAGNGVIFEWDPLTNIYTKKVDFSSFGQPFAGPRGNLTLYKKKFYGLTPPGESHGLGEIFEWDPATNIYTVKVRFDSANGFAAFGSLALSEDKFYGTLNLGGINNNGVLFEWDPATNIYTKKKDFAGTDGAFSNDLARVPAPVAPGVSGNCVTFPSITVDDSNNNIWLPIMDEKGNAVAEIKANGNNLGLVTASIYINKGAVREDVENKLYLDRNITLASETPPGSAIDIRLYIKGSEFLALQNSVHSNGASSEIRNINDLLIYQNGDICLPAASILTGTISASPEVWGGDYVFTTKSTTLSSFYFAGKPQCPAPVIICNEDIVVNAPAGSCGIVVRYKVPVIKDDCETTTLQQTSGKPGDAFFPVGTTINTFVATSASGKKDSCSFKIEVRDSRGPIITPVLPYPAILWPADHTMRNVSINYFAWDHCGTASCVLDVKSDEPVSGTGPGDKSPDWVIVDNHHVKLRAERSGNGNGRVYTVTVTCSDASGNTTARKTRIFVPHHTYGYYSKGPYDFGQDSHHHAGSIENDVDDFLDCKVSPNPSSQNFTMEIKSISNEKIEVSLSDIAGRLILKPVTVKNNTFRFGDKLQPGVYFAEIRQGLHKRIIKVVKQ